MLKPTLKNRELFARTLMQIRTRVFAVILILAFGLVFTSSISHPQTASAVTSSNINFQARLQTSAGLIVPDGLYNVQFKLYDTQSNGTGTNLWTESYYDSNGVAAGNDNRVRVVHGYLTVNLGSQTAFPNTINWDQQLYLTMNIGGTAQTATPTYDGEMLTSGNRMALTAVPYAFQAKQAATLVQKVGSFTGTVDFSTLTADRKFLFPDTALATSASPGTICVYNGASSNCPAATGSAAYIQNSVTLQSNAANFNIQSADSGVAGTVTGTLRGAAAGQTVDLLQFQASGGAVLAAVNAAGNLNVASAVDTYTATTLALGNSTATAVSICNSAACDVVNIGTNTDADIITIGDASDTVGINGAVTVLGATNINNSGSANTTIGVGSSGTIAIGNSLSGAITLQSNSTIGIATNSTLSIATSNFTVNTAGAVTLAGGLSSDITTTPGAAVNGITLKPGTASGASNNGGALNLNGGDASGTTNVIGGALNLVAGNATGASGTRTGGSASLDAGTGNTANGGVSVGTVNANSVAIGRTGKTTTINGALTVTQATTLSGALLTNNGATLNTAMAITDRTAGTSWLSGASSDPTTTVDNHTAFTINQSTASVTVQVPSPTVTTAGRVIYISDIGSASFTLLGSALGPGSTATLIWNGSAWTFAGVDGGSANYIQNQLAGPQVANFYIKSASAIATDPTAQLQLASGQTGDYLQFRDSLGALKAKVANDGSIAAYNFVDINGTGPFLNFGAAAAILDTRINTNVGLVIKGQASQSGNLLQFQNNSGNPIANITATGNLNVASAIDTYAAGTLSVGNSTATAVSICNSAACNVVNIGTNTDADIITIGDASDTVGINGGVTVTGVLGVTSTTTNSGLSVTQSGNPVAGQALIFANNTNASPSGSLIDLRSNNVSKFSVNTAGNIAGSGTLQLSGSTGNSYVMSNLGVGTTGPNRKAEIQDATNPQLRLSSSSTIYTDLQTDSTGALTVTPSGAVINFVAPLGVGYTDQFNSTTLSSGWTFTANGNDLFGNSSYTLSENPGYMRIYANGNSSNDCSGGAYYCSRLLRPTTSGDGSYNAEINLSTIPSNATWTQGYEHLNSGIMIVEDPANFMIFGISEYGAVSGGMQLTNYGNVNGSSTGTSATLNITGHTALTIRIVKSGTTYTYQYHFENWDGSTWVTYGSSTLGMSPNQAGIMVASNSTGHVPIDYNYFTSTVSPGVNFTVSGYQSLTGSLTVGGAALFQGVTSTTAFQIQDTTGTSNLFIADTKNSKINIGGLLTVTGGATVSGGVVNLNVSSNFNTNINTGSSTGAVNIGNSAAGVITVTSGSTFALSSTNLSVSTAGTVTLLGNTASDITTATGASTNQITIKPGTASGASNSGASATLQGGDASGTTSVTGGALNLKGGNATGASGTRNGGSIFLDAGTGGTANGNIFVGQFNAVQVSIGKASSTATTILGSAINLNNSGTGTTAIGVGSSGTITVGNASSGAISVVTGSTFGLTATGAISVTSSSTFALSSTNLSVAAATGVVTLMGGNATGDITTAAAATGAGITIKPGNSTGANINGGTLTLQGGGAASGNANGGSVAISGGAGVGTGVQGLVNLSTTAFTSAATQAFGASGSLTAGLVDLNSTIPVNATTTGVTVTVPVPAAANQVVGRILYITAVNGSNDFSLTLSGTSPVSIAMKANSTATLIWNGNGWTAAGASSSTDLQSAYNNTLSSAGGAEIVLAASGGSADGLTIRNNAASPIIGALLEVQSSTGANLFSVNNSAVEYAVNGGAETATGYSTNWSGVPLGGTVTRTTTAGTFATGQAATQVVTTTTAGTGAKNVLSTTLTAGSTYQVSFAAKLNSGTFATLDVNYSKDGTATGLASCITAQTLSTTVWSKITCTFTAAATITASNAIFITQSDAGTARTFYIENLSVTIVSTTSNPANVQIGGGLYGGQPTLFTLDRFSSPPVAAGNTTYYGSMYYDTTTGRIQCYESDGWGACGSSPDNIVTLTPEYTGAVLNGTGIGTLTSDFCANETTGITFQVGTLCALHETRNFYKWTSPQATSQTYSIYVNYKLPSTFKQFADDNTIKLTALTDNTTNGSVSYEIYRKNVSGNVITQCGTTTTVTSIVNTWQQVSANGNEFSTCTWAGGDYVVFKINVTAKSNANVYVENLDFTFSNK